MKKLILGFAILLVIVAILIGCAPKTKVYPPQGEPVEPAAAPSEPAQPSAAQEDDTPVSAPTGLREATLPELKNCETEYAIGWVPNSCRIRDKEFSITLKAVGKGGIDGIVFYVVGPTGTKVMLEDSTEVGTGEEHAYAFSLSELEGRVGGRIQEILALPIKTVSGSEYACFNQRLLVIKDEACRG